MLSVVVPAPLRVPDAAACTVYVIVAALLRNASSCNRCRMVSASNAMLRGHAGLAGLLAFNHACSAIRGRQKMQERLALQSACASGEAYCDAW